MSEPAHLRRSSRESTAHSTAETEAHTAKRAASRSRSRTPEKSSKKVKKDESAAKEEGEKQVEKTSEVEEKAGEEKEIKAEGGEPAAEATVEGESRNATAGQLPPGSFGVVTEKDAERKYGILEEGHIYFLYRPKVELDEAHSLDDVARFQILLLPSPESQPDPAHKKFRLIAVGRKHLPSPGTAGTRHEALWGEVVEVGDDLSGLRKRLGPSTYQTKTRGERHLAPMRVAGRGRYLLHCSTFHKVPAFSKNQSAIWKTYIAYALSVPHELGEVQEELNIQHEGAFQLQVKTPGATSNNPRVREQRPATQAKYPSSLSSLFTTKFIPANPAPLLNFSGAELLFITSRHSVPEDVGEEVARRKLEEAAEEESWEFGEAGAEEAIKELGLKEGDVEIAPLEGHWA